MKRAMTIVACALLLGACGDRNDQVAQQEDAYEKEAKKLLDPAQEEENIKEQQSPKPANDATDYKALPRYLPRFIDGYNAVEDPGGSTQDIDGFTITSTQQEWEGDDPSQRLTVSVIDCGQAEGGYMRASELYLLPADGGGSDLKVTKIDGKFSNGEGVVAFDRAQESTQLTVGVNRRYIIELQSTGGGDRTRMLLALAEEIAAGL